MNEMTIYKFLKIFYGIELDYTQKVSHADIKKNFPFLKRTSLDYADNNAKKIALGEIVYVSDYYGRYLPYIKPQRIDELEENVVLVETSVQKEEDKYSKYYEITIQEILNLPTHILRELLAHFKYKPFIYRKIKQELEKRGIYENKRYKLLKEIEKEENEIEESELYVKYKRRQRVKYSKS